jgi:hypothetical protein
MDSHDALALADYRRRVHAMYATVRGSDNPEEAWIGWRLERDQLFRTHQQSPIDIKERDRFGGLRYFSYDPDYRFEVAFESVHGSPTSMGHSAEGETRFTAVGAIRLPVGDREESLTVYWLDAYGGGLFLPFRDATAGVATYGGGRYLLDSVKGADLGGSAGRLVIDFNFAYHPSCVYSSRWSCPLAPRVNWMTTRVEAGERSQKPLS